MTFTFCPIILISGVPAFIYKINAQIEKQKTFS